MSEARLELVETILCEHDYDGHHDTFECWTHEGRHKPEPSCFCPGNQRRVLSVPTEEMVRAFENAYWEYKRNNDVTDTPDHRKMFRAALTAAFNTLGIQEKVE
jgi:hypothetical protein